MSSYNNPSKRSGQECFHNSNQYLRKLNVVYKKSDILKINLIIAVDRTAIAQSTEVYPRPDKDFGSICAN